MKEKYTQQDIDLFFDLFKKLPQYYQIEKVHQLINNPDAKAGLSGKSNFKPFKLILMTTMFMAGLTVLMLWFSPYNKDKISENGIKEKHANRHLTLEEKELLRANNNKAKPIIFIDTMLSLSVQKGKFPSNHPFEKTSELTKNEKVIPENGHRNCNWPEDTIIDRNILIVDLSDDELMKIGIIRKGKSTYYHNKTPNGNYDMSYYTNEMAEKEWITTNNMYYITEVTNPFFEPDGNTIFYSSMDTLVPVKSGNRSNQLFWFSPHESFFEALPSRYDYLKAVYDNLKCLKRKYPTKSFTNYLAIGGKIILEPIRILELSKEGLKKINIGITDECVSFVSKNQKLTIKKCNTGGGISGSDEDFGVFPPNPFPVAFTDTLGRRVHVQENIIKRDSLSEIMSILIPVKVNFIKLIPPNKEVLICWFYPTDEFVNALPAEIKMELKTELDFIRVNMKNKLKTTAASCNYFEVCKSTLQVDDFKVFPNPAKYSATVKFINSQNVTGTVSLVNIAGAQIKVLVKETTFLPGRNSFHLDLNGITSGIYLIALKTNQGFITQRLIITQ